jgi:lysozyme
MALLAPALAAGCATEPTPEAQEEAAAPAPDAAPAPAEPLPKLTTRDEPPPSASRGIDVSHYSGAVDWGAVRDAGVHFAYVKATEGVDSADPAFASHWEELGRDPSVLRGAYHFYVTEDDPEEQARFFLSTVTLRPGDLPPVVDVEILGHDTQPGLADRLATFLGIVERETGARPIIYTAPNFWNAHLTDRFGDYPLWVAEYGVSAPVTPEGWTEWTLWQWEKDVDVPGIEKGADLSHLHPDVDLESFRIPAPDGR